VEHGALGHRGKLIRGAGGLRATRGSTAENANPAGSGSQRSPRLGTCAAAGPPQCTRGAGLYGFSNSRLQGGVLGDITNIAAKTEKAKTVLKQLQKPQPPQAEPPIASSPSAADAHAEPTPLPRSLVTIRDQVINVQDCEEYAADLNNHLFQEEVAFMACADYMNTQTDLTPKMRTILVDWLVEVHMKYRLRPETLHLTVNLIDRLLTRMPVMRKRLQLVGVVAIFIAAKFEEINPPELHDWVYITDKAYTKEDVLTMECTMLTTLSFQIMVPTPAHFFPLFQKANGCNAVHRHLAQYILELSLLDIRMLHFTASHIVSAALLLSNEVLGRCTVWPPSMVHYCRHTDQSLRGCVDVLRQLFEADRAGSGGQLQALHKKFSSKDYLAVATMAF